MHRRRGRRQTQVQGLTWPLRNRLLEATGDRLIDVRNRALLAVGYDTLLRRSELVSLDVPDVLEEIDGTATLLVRAGKTDADGRGATLYLARDTVQLVKTWLERGRVGGGRVLRSVRKDGTVGEKLDASQVPRIYKRMARRAGLPDDIVDTLAGHSTRVGAVQDMIACGIELPAILQSGRWQTTRMVQRYGERLLARRCPAGRAAEALSEAAPRRYTGRHAAGGGGLGVDVRPPFEGFAPDARRDVIASKTRPRCAAVRPDRASRGSRRHAGGNPKNSRGCSELRPDATGLRIVCGMCTMKRVWVAEVRFARDNSSYRE